MRKASLVSCLIVSLLLPSVLEAQLVVELTAKVLKLAKAPTCSKNATHAVSCTDIVLLAGKGVNLANFENKHVSLKGKLLLRSCPTLEVTEIKTTGYHLKITALDSGGFKLGNRVRFRTRAPFLSIVPWFLAAKPFFLPLQSFGTLMLDPLSLIYVQNNIALFGSVTITVRIPNDKALIGALVFSQGAFVTLLPSIDGRLLNTDCFKIIN